MPAVREQSDTVGPGGLLPVQRLDGRVRGEEERVREAFARRAMRTRDSWWDAAYVFTQQDRERRMLALLTRNGQHPLAGKRLLEIGCGQGNILRDFIKWGARPDAVHGIDLLPERIETARRLCPPGVELRAGDATSLDYGSDTFDLVVQSTLFTSVLDDGLRRRLAGEMLRVVKPAGLIVWYDFRVDNPRNPDVRGVRGRDIAVLFPDCDITLELVTLAPPLTRRLAPRSRFLCSVLAAVPWLRTHYLGAIRRRGSSSEARVSARRA